MNKYKLLSTDNGLTYGNNCIGEVSSFNFDGTTFYFSHIRSSAVKSISISGDLMLVQTKNTLYTFSKETK